LEGLVEITGKVANGVHWKEDRTLKKGAVRKIVKRWGGNIFCVLERGDEATK